LPQTSQSQPKSKSKKANLDEFDELDLEPVNIEEVYRKLRRNLEVGAQCKHQCLFHVSRKTNICFTEKIGDYLRKEVCSFKSGQSDSVIQKLITNTKGILPPRPQHAQDVQTFMKHYYKSMVKASLEGS
jgi:hypothetical protein